ncbi:hypothetical protein BHM03_00037703 [Ensete ventricosum]|nr:hypothetical protein BHM03_00037703 [Ensete ventricosum]
MPGGAIEDGRWLRCGSETRGKRRQSRKRGKEEGKKQGASDEEQEKSQRKKEQEIPAGRYGGHGRISEILRGETRLSSPPPFDVIYSGTATLSEGRRRT